MGRGWVGELPPHPIAKLINITFPDGRTAAVHAHEQRTSHPNTDWWWAFTKGIYSGEAPSGYGYFFENFLWLRILLSKRRNTTYIDTGAWIGPFVLFAAPYALHTFALEPVLTDAAELYWNVAANPAVAARTTVLNMCVVATGVRPLMRSSGIYDRFSKHLDIACTTLDAFVLKHNIDASNLVLRLDTEGSERDILPQLAPWIRTHRPTILLHLHVFVYQEDMEAHRVSKDVVLRYKHVFWLLGTMSGPVDRASFDVKGLCRLCVLLLTELDLSPDDLLQVKMGGGMATAKI